MNCEQKIINFVNSSGHLRLTDNYFVQDLRVYVDVVNNHDAEKVISELIELVKIPKPNGSFFSKVTVHKKNSSLIQFYVSYHKKVIFLNKYKERITKDIATYMLKKFN